MQDLACRYSGAWKVERFRKDTLPAGTALRTWIFRLVGSFKLRCLSWPDDAWNIACFGNRRLQCLYVEEIVADYLGNGLSANHRDEAFLPARPQLLHDYLGLPYVKRRKADLPRDCAVLWCLPLPP